MDFLKGDSSKSQILQISELAKKFEWPEYVVFGFFLVLSGAIGIFYGCFGSKQKSNEEFLLGNRQMSPLLVAMSMLCSFISAITLMGYPVEVYLYGTQYFLSILSFPLLTLAMIYIYAPVYFELQLTSASEYLELRYNKGLRVIVSVLTIIFLITYNAVVVYSPSLILNQVTGLDHRWSVAYIFALCIFYSTLGGYKAVLWTDALQCVIMLVSLAIVIILGFHKVGGFRSAWEKMSNTGRVDFWRFDIDPRTRHTVWTAILGGYFSRLPFYAATQANIQRIVSIPTIAEVNRALIYNMIGLFLLNGLPLLSGVAIFAMYHDCDPVLSKTIERPDRLLPLFVMDTLGDYPGVPGIFVAGLTCASLSTVSTGLNALAAIITTDYVKPWYPKFSDEKLSRISKLASMVTGILSYGLTFGAEHMGNVLQATTSLIGMLLSPIVGTYTLGLLIPWANSKGAMLGLLTSLALIMYINLGAIIESSALPDQRLSLSVANCGDLGINSTIVDYEPKDWKSRHDSFEIQLFSVSYLWFAVYGCISSFTFGLLFSFVFFFWQEKPELVDRKCITPIFLKFWSKNFPRQMRNLGLIKTLSEDNFENKSM